MGITPSLIAAIILTNIRRACRIERVLEKYIHTSSCCFFFIGTATTSQRTNSKMEEAKDVVLHVYKLTAPEGGAASFFTKTLLPSLGMGTYHTSLEVDGYRYTYAANRGIIKTASHRDGLPGNATFQESIALGGSGFRNNHRGAMNELMKKLGETFQPNTYHLVHRNCNHFSETLATAIILYEKLADKKVPRLAAYPEWVNRLANTGKMVVSHDADIISCNVLQEARRAVGADDKVSWNFDGGGSNSKSTKTSSSSSRTKKELTPAQKAALAKIRGKK